MAYVKVNVMCRDANIRKYGIRRSGAWMKVEPSKDLSSQFRHYYRVNRNVLAAWVTFGVRE